MTTIRRIGAVSALALAATTLVTACAAPPTAEVGTCLLSEDLESQEVDELTPIDCATSHDIEVFAKADLPDGNYPGEDAILEAGDAICEENFTTYVGTEYWESSLDFIYLYPIENSWLTGDREILCMIVSEESVTGTLKDAHI